MSDGSKKPVSDRLLEILACPVCKASVEIWPLSKSDSGLKCSKCNRIYPIRDGIPVMLESEVLSGENKTEK
ncbi:MAG: Trm112 family protein [Candidatus Aminicenantes bacterium]|nr:Trm112 family protein [Candidatus Aminicenantes bacterium]